MTNTTPINRRGFVLGAGAAVVAAACTSSDGPAAADEPSGSASTDTAAPTSQPTGSETTTAAATIAALTVADFEGLSTCTSTPSAGAGPFPNLDKLDRRDIGEGYPGHPLRIGFRIVDEQCAAIADARVEIWHCDASGDYSSYEDRGSGKDEGEGSSFCRGIQSADVEGIVEFQTIYPGWYEGRAVHIHLTVHIGDEEVLTTQVYFDEGYTSNVYAAAPYDEFGEPDTSHADDGLAGDPGAAQTLLSLRSAETTNGVGTLALINVGV